MIDDEALIGGAIRRALGREHDVEVHTAPRAALACLVAGERYDVILCDLMMPDLTGMDLHRELLRVAPEQCERVVFMTGDAFTREAREFLAGVDNPHLDKPFDFTALRSLIRARVG